MFRCTNIGSLWWCFFGFLAAFAVGYAVSLLTGRENVAAADAGFSFETSTGDQLTIHNVVQLAVAGKIRQKDEDGFYVVPGKLDKIGYALVAFFIVQCVVLSLI